MCNKIKYASPEAARKDAIVISADAKRHGNSRRDTKRFRPYPCKHCGQYHLTSVTQHRKW
jgi:hypothetical protein